MAAPPLTARVLPDGVSLGNGFGSMVVFQLAPSLDIFEKSVQPPAMDGGDKIDTTTHLNSVYESSKPQCLVSHDDAVVIAAYDPAVLSTIEDMINEEQSISFLYPDGSAYVVWGYLKRAEPSPLVKGVQPEITLTIVVTDWDPTLCVEAGPVFVDGTGSCVC